MSTGTNSYRGRPAGMVGAVLATLGLIGAVWLLSLVQHPATVNPAPTVNFRPSLAQARTEAPFPVLAPRPVPPGWRATSVSWQGVGPRMAWHVGFLTQGGHYVGLAESNQSARGFIAASTPARSPAGTVVVNGATWRKLVSSNGTETALVLTQGGVTTVVTGTAPTVDIVGFTASLSAR